MHRIGFPRAVAFLTCLLLASGLALTLAISARAAESAHLKLGIVGRDEISSRGGVRGVRVIEVFGPSSRRAGIKRGDVVLRLDGRRVHDAEELDLALEELGEGTFSVEVLRRGEIRELRVPRERTLVLDDRVDVDREVIQEIVRDIRTDVRRTLGESRHRDIRVLRDVRVLRDQREELREAVDGLRRQLRELEAQLEAEDWH